MSRTAKRHASVLLTRPFSDGSFRVAVQIKFTGVVESVHLFDVKQVDNQAHAEQLALGKALYPTLKASDTRGVITIVGSL